MILENNKTIKINKRTLKYYNEKGYKCVLGDNIKVDVEDISKGSHIKIKVKCDNDNCKTVNNVSIKTHNRNTNNGYKKYYCNNCKNIKTKETNLEKYGVENVFQLDNVKEKSKKTNLEKYGVENVMHNTIIKKKVEKTKLIKYGNHAYNNPEKTKKTILEKYTKHYMYDVSIKKKIKETNLEKYGVKHHLMSSDVRDKIKKTSNEHIFGKYKKITLDDYNLLNYKNDIFEILHKPCGDISHLNNREFHHRKIGERFCEKCFEKNTFLPERELFNWIQSLNISQDDIINNDRKILKGKELDIYLPTMNLAIEFNGIYWHSEKFKDRKYHLNKTNECLNNNINLIHIYEDDWNYKKDIIKSYIKNKMDINNKIDSNECIIKTINNIESKIFQINNSLKKYIKTEYTIGLYYNNVLVSIMGLSYRKIKKNKELELKFFIQKNNLKILNGAEKLFNYFIKNYKLDVSYIVVYDNIGMCEKNLYEDLGFKYTDKLNPNYT